VLADLPDRPVVYATLGTFSNTDTAVFRSILDGLAELPVTVVLTVGAGNDPAVLAPVPDNARVERYVPQADLLPHCALVVNHAGAGTVLGALAHGLPQLVLPQGADNFVTAERLVVAGAAAVLRPGEVTAGAVRDAVATLLADGSYRMLAEEIADEIAALPAPKEIAAELRRRHGGL
jgi:MGT family glycosyltransferase